MRSLLSIAVLISAATPALANITFNPVPEPETLGLLAVAGVALLLARSRKK